MSRSRRLAALLSALAVLIVVAVLAAGGCGDDEPEPPPPDAEAGSEDAEAAATVERWTAAELAPRIRPLGGLGRVPREIVVELARPIVDPDQVGRPALEGTVLRLEPPVEGELYYRSASSLGFRPRDGFPPGSRIEVRLEAVATAAGVVTAPVPNPWMARLEIPEFGFLHLALAGFDEKRRRAELDLHFAAAPDLRDVERRARFTVVRPDGERRRPDVVSWSEGEGGAVRAAIDQVRPGVSIELELAAGVAARGDSSLAAAAASGEVTIPAGARLSIKALEPTEGGGGFYLDVVCDDDAVSEERWFWDQARERSHGQLSVRCVPREDSAREHVTIDPALPFTIAEWSGGFRIFGDFERGTYTVRIASGLTSRDGGVLAEEVERDIAIPARKPRVAFAGGGRYLPRSAWRSLAVRHLNANRLTLLVRRVPPENLVFWMSDDDETATERTSDLVLSHDLTVEGAADELATTFVDVGSLLPADTRGLLELTLAGSGTSSTARLLLTDLQLVVKRAGVSRDAPHGREVAVWALDSRTLRPERGVEVRLIKPSGTTVGSCRTAGEGGCRIAVPEPGVDQTAPFALVARSARDLTYLRFADLRVEVQETRVAGEPWAGAQPYRAALYTDRGVYRPGETAHLAAIVRGADDQAPPAGLPAVLVLVDPRGTPLTRRTLATNAAGMATFDQPFAAFATTGRYEARLEIGDRRVGSAHFQVEEFVPERLKVDAETAAPAFRLGEALRVEVASRYLFGGVPADHRVELSCELVPGSFAPRENADLHYGVWEADDGLEPLTLGTVTGALDAGGEATLACAGGEDAGGFAGPATLIARAAVFESGSGRTTVGTANAAVHPEAFYIGLASGAEKAGAGDTVEVRGMVVDWQGRPVAAARELEVEVLAVESQYGWAFDEDLGHDTYKRYRRAVPSERGRTVRAENGRFRFTWEPRGEAEAWVVRVRAAGTRARTDLEIAGDGSAYWWAPWETQVDQTPKPDRPSWIALDVPESIRAGERVTVGFDAPYRGRALLAVETDRMVRTEWRSVDAGPVEWRFTLDDFVPNVYVSALVVKDPLLDSREAFVPDRAYGVESARVEPAAFTQEVGLEVPAKVRSQSTLSVRLDVGPREGGERAGPTWATVAVVDEGVLSLTRFASPDPFAAIFARRALGVETFETIGWTRLAPAAGSNAAAGGDRADPLGRVQPVEPVALWSGLVEVPADGRLTLPFELPPYRGELRVMAVTASPRRMGRAEARVTVADPIVVQATVPRVLAFDDRVEVPVQVTNLSGARRTIEVGAKVTALGGGDGGEGGAPPVRLDGPAARSLTLDDGASGLAVFPLHATEATGAVRFEARAVAGEVTVTEGHDLPLVPTAPIERRVERVELAEGANDLTGALGEWLPTTGRTTVWVTSNQYADVFDHLSHLIRYPYGCLEQTTSTTRPLLVLGPFVRAVDPRAVSEAAVEDMVRAGIERILSMQTPAGGFAYWPGGTEPAWWATANATHLLLDAQKAGFAVPQSRLDDALDWIEGRITSHYERGGEGDEHDWYSKDAEPYMHYVLALAGRPRKARIQRLIDGLPRPARGERAEHEWMLEAALYMAGDHRYERDLRRPELGPLSEERETGWTFYSDRRRRGFVLASYVELFGREGAEPLAATVAEALRGQRSAWYTTQELVWGLTGLGRYLREPARDVQPPVLTVGGKPWPAVENPPGRPAADRTFEVPRAGERGKVVLQVPKKGEGTLWAIVSGEGVPVTPSRKPGGGAGLGLVRRYRNAAGDEIAADGAAVVLGELVFVELEVHNIGGERVGNLALVDRVPAGWEIENPRLGRGLRPEWIDEDALWSADHMDVRDDRIEVFGHLESRQRRTLVYTVRAVGAGEFTVPAATLEAMYDPRLWAQTTAGKTAVLAPWGDE